MYLEKKSEAVKMLETLRGLWLTKNEVCKKAIEAQASKILARWPELKKTSPAKAAAPKKATVFVVATATSMAFLTKAESGWRFAVLPAGKGIDTVVNLLKRGVTIITDSQTAVRPIIRPRGSGDWDILKKMRAWLK